MSTDSTDAKKTYYKKNIQKVESELKLTKKKRTFVSFALIVSFILLCGSLYLYFISEKTPEHLLLPLFSLICFVVSSRIDSRFLQKIDFLKALIECNGKELDYLCGDFSKLDPGNMYINPAHPYSNDLDVFGNDSLYQVINRTITPNGAARMAEILQSPCHKRKAIEERQEATQELIEKVEWYQTFMAGGSKRHITATNDQMIQDWKNRSRFFQSDWAKKLVYSCNILTLTLLFIGIFEPKALGLAIVFVLFQMMTALFYAGKINKLNEQLGRFIGAVGNYVYLAKVIHEVHFTSSLLAELEKILFSEKNALTAFSKLNRIQNGFEGRGNVLVTILLNGLYMHDLHLIFKLEKWKEEYIDRIDRWIASINEMEVLVSMANFRFNHPQYALPSVQGENMVDAEALGHPLIPAEQMITNNFQTADIHQLYIVTGANMAGKSTFLRAVGVNMVLALTGNVVCAKSFRFMPVQIFTSMRTTDNLAKGTSYFHAELLRLKALIDSISDDRPHFIILDEMLKGTNSKDKLNGSIKFLHKLLTLPVSGLIATHDLALGQLSEEDPEHFFNICFEIEHSESAISYDYKLKKGVSQNMNASILMEQMGLI